MKSFLTKVLMLAAFCTAAGSGGVLAAPGGPDPEPAWQADSEVEKANASIAKGDWKGAAEVMKQALGGAPQNAEYHNLYAYATRKGPNPDMNLVFKHYTEALRLKPDYRGAHEYIGEAYLMTGNLAKAKEHLSRLDRLCTFGCEEYTLLKKAVAEYEARKK